MTYNNARHANIKNSPTDGALVALHNVPALLFSLDIYRILVQWTHTHLMHVRPWAHCAMSVPVPVQCPAMDTLDILDIPDTLDTLDTLCKVCDCACAMSSHGHTVQALSRLHISKHESLTHDGAFVALHDVPQFLVSLNVHRALVPADSRAAGEAQRVARGKCPAHNGAHIRLNLPKPSADELS